jgi:hypothetical protein
MATRITLHPRFARRLPDPFSNSTHGTERHIFFVRVHDLPAGLSLDPSPRALKTRWDIYKEVQASLLDQDCTPGTFHLKNRGITIVARHVEKIDENEYQIELGEGHGVVDGAHTYRLILETRQDPHIELPRQQFVRIEVVTKVPQAWIPEIAGALNTSIQGQRNSLAHLQDALQWMKDELQNEKYCRSIAWSEHERGIHDVRDVLSILTCFNTSLYPNAGTHHPVVAYDNKSVVISTFEEEFRNNGGRAFMRLKPILKDILVLHDTIQLEFPKFCRELGLRAPEIIETSSKRPFEFPFIQTKATERLARGALYPVLAAFRWFVDDDKANAGVSWRGGFDAIVSRWRTAAERLATQSVERVREVGGSADALGRSPSHWSMLHKELAFIELMAPQAPVEPVPAPQHVEPEYVEPEPVELAADGERSTAETGPTAATARREGAAHAGDAGRAAAATGRETDERAPTRTPRMPAPDASELVEIPLTGIHRRLDPVPDSDATGEIPVLLDPAALVTKD